MPLRDEGRENDDNILKYVKAPLLLVSMCYSLTSKV